MRTRCSAPASGPSDGRMKTIAFGVGEGGRCERDLREVAAGRPAGRLGSRRRISNGRSEGE